jgi:hypothetical protein
MGVNRYPGELQHYEGTSAQCDGEQEVREIFYDTTSGTLRYKTIAGDIVYFERVIGGASGYIPKFISNTSQGNSVIYESNGNVGIGTTTPLGKLCINGGIHVGGDSDAGDDNALIDGKLGLGGAGVSQGTLSLTATSDDGNNGITYFPYRAASTTGRIYHENDSSTNTNFIISRGTTSTNGVCLAANANFGIGTINPLDKLDVNGNIRASGTIINPSGMMTSQGGFATLLTNNTGTTTVKGQIVHASGTLGFNTALVNDEMPIGIVLDAGVANGSKAWIVVGGVAEVLIDAGGCTVGDWVGTGATAGSANGDPTVPVAAQHFQEVGHPLETRVGAGLARCIIHFN